MALDDDAVLNPAVGHYYFAPVGTAKPTDPMAPAAPWADLGHTSLEEPFGITSEGGETTTLGTWQNKKLRNVNAPRVQSVAFVLQQWDADALKLYYGSNSATASDGSIREPENPVETEGALYVLVEDGFDQVAFYWPRVSVYRADDISFDSEALAGLPVRATILGTTGQDWISEITPKGDLAAVSIEVSPASPSVADGATVQLTATATYGDSSTRNVTADCDWSSSNETFATVSAAGLVTGVAAGSATITADYGDLTDTAAVTVTA